MTLGNQTILKSHKLALFCSIKCPGNLILQTYELAKSLRDKGITVISGFHSPMEQEVLNILLKGNQPVIICPARSIENMQMPKDWRKPIDEGRLLVISTFSKKFKRMTSNTSQIRNDFVADIADEIFVVYASPGGKMESFCRNLLSRQKPLFTLIDEQNSLLIKLGAKPIPVAVPKPLRLTPEKIAIVEGG